MRKKKGEIIKILEENDEGLEIGIISEQIGLSYDTTSRYLKEMKEKGILTRKAVVKKREKKYSRESNYCPWTYHYSIK